MTMAAQFLPARQNTRAAKAVFLYDGHNRRPGISRANDTRRWRHIRRDVTRWLRDIIGERA